MEGLLVAVCGGCGGDVVSGGCGGGGSCEVVDGRVAVVG